MTMLSLFTGLGQTGGTVLTDGPVSYAACITHEVLSLPADIIRR